MMKKLLFFTAILTAISFRVAAQEYQYVPFPDSGAVWSEMYSSEETLVVYERFTITGEDTLINNLQYRKLYIFYDEIFDTTNARCVGGIREDEKKRVYFKGDFLIHRLKPFSFIEPIENEILLYDFSLEIGDTINFDVENEIFLCIKSIDTIQIENSQRKVFKFEKSSARWIEGIGNTRGLLFSSFGLPTGGEHGYLICFLQNNEVLYHDEYYNDCFPSNVGVESKKLNLGIQVYPNPANGNTVRFEWGDSEIENIEVFNLLGELVGSTTVTAKSFVDYPTNKMQPGIYVYKAIDKNGFCQTGRFVVE